MTGWGRVYYWFGENKDTTTQPDAQLGFNIEAVGISRYTSPDLYNRQHQGLVLPAVDAPPTTTCLTAG